MEQSKIWKPASKKQELFLSLPDSIFEALFGGAAFGGKSEVLMMLPLVRGFINHPRFKGILFRRTFPELQKEIMIRCEDYYGPSGASKSDGGKCWTWPSGARMFFSHLEHEADVKKHDTSEYNYVAFDELTSFTKYQYTYIGSQRCRTSIAELPAIVRGGTNPGNVGHDWVKKHFKIPDLIGQAADGEVEPGTIIADKITGNKRIFIQSLMEDNVVGMQNDPQYGTRLELMRPVSEADYQAKRFGRWDVFEGQVFGEFRIERLSDEPENACHVIDLPKIEPWYPIVLAIDWGYTAMTYAVWSAVLPNGRAIVFREFSCKREKISHWATEIGRISKELGEMSDIVLCASAFAKRGDEKTIAEQFEEHSGLRPRQADNDRVGGKLLLQDFLRWKPKPLPNYGKGIYDKSYADLILRTQGLGKYEEYLASFKEPEPEKELPRLLISRACQVLVKTIPLCVYDDKNKEDVKEFDGDDPYDTLRYLCKAVDYYVSRSERELKKRVEIEKIVAQQSAQPDWNRFYMQMRMKESQERRSLAPTRRFH